MIAKGDGPPLVLIPGIQGRWEWMRPAIDVLAATFEVHTYSLLGEPGSGSGRQPPATFDDFTHQLNGVLNRAGLDSAIVVGVSFGGWVAARYAAQHPHRVARLVLVSTPGPRWTPDEHVARYLRAPRLFAPAFAMRSFRRMYREVIVALPDRLERRRFVLGHFGRVVRAPMSPRRMAHRVRLASAVDFVETARRIQAPTLLVTGEAGLDVVVPVEQTLQYGDVIPHARHVSIANTGHVGVVTRAHIFASHLIRFIEEEGTGIHPAAAVRRPAHTPRTIGLSHPPRPDQGP